MIGPGKGIDTTSISSSARTSSEAATGRPGRRRSIPATGKPYGIELSPFHHRRHRQAQKRLARPSRRFPKLLCLIGGSIGGMQALEWAVDYPEMVHSVIPIASTCGRSALSIGLSEAQRQAIMADPDWERRRLLRAGPQQGARPGPHHRPHHLPFRSLDGEEVRPEAPGKLRLQVRFLPGFPGRKLPPLPGEKIRRTVRRQLLSLHHQGLDYFDLGEQRGDGSLVKAFSRASGRNSWSFPSRRIGSIRPLNPGRWSRP